MSLILTTGHGSWFRDAHMTQFRPMGKQETFPGGIRERNLLAIQRKLLEESFFPLFLPPPHLWMHTRKHVASLDNHHVPGRSWLCWKQSQNRRKLGPWGCCEVTKSNQPWNLLWLPVTGLCISCMVQASLGRFVLLRVKLSHPEFSR